MRLPCFYYGAFDENFVHTERFFSKNFVDTKINCTFVACDYSASRQNSALRVILLLFMAMAKIPYIKRLYVHEVTLKEKILDYSSNPVRVDLQATNQGDVAKVLQNILSTK